MTTPSIRKASKGTPSAPRRSGGSSIEVIDDPTRVYQFPVNMDERSFALLLSRANAEMTEEERNGAIVSEYISRCIIGSQFMKELPVGRKRKREEIAS